MAVAFAGNGSQSIDIPGFWYGHVRATAVVPEARDREEKREEREEDDTFLERLFVRVTERPREDMLSFMLYFNGKTYHQQKTSTASGDIYHQQQCPYNNIRLYIAVEGHAALMIINFKKFPGVYFLC